MAAQIPDYDEKLIKFLGAISQIARHPALRQPEVKPSPPKPLESLTQENLQSDFAKKFKRPEISKNLQGAFEGSGVGQLFNKAKETANQAQIEDVLVQKALNLLKRSEFANPDFYLMKLKGMDSSYAKQSNPQLLSYLLKAFKNPAILNNDKTLSRLLGPEKLNALVAAAEQEEQPEKAEESKEPEKKKESKETEKRKISGSARKAEEEIEKPPEPSPSIKPPQTAEATKSATEIFTEKYGPAPTIPPTESILSKALPKAKLPESPVELGHRPPTHEIEEPASASKIDLYQPVPIFPDIAPVTQELPATEPSTTPSSPGAAPQSEDTAPPPQTPTPSSSAGEGGGGLPNPLRGRGLNNNLARFGVNQVTKKYKWLLYAILALTLVVFLFAIFDQLQRSIPFLPLVPACFNQAGGGTGGCPSQATIDENRGLSLDERTASNQCRFLDPAINMGYQEIPPETLATFVANNYKRSGLSQEAFAQRLQTINQMSKQAGFNPAVIIGLWRSESGFGSFPTPHQFGCLSGDSSFESQVACALGMDGKGSVSSRCVNPNNPDREAACIEAQGIVNSRDNADVYNNTKYPASIHKFSTPYFQTFDDWHGVYGPHDPELCAHEPDHCRGGPGQVNTNCTGGYNNVLSVVIELSMCSGSTRTTGGGNIAACKFYRNDQTPNRYPYKNIDDFLGCPPESTCAAGLPFKSQKIVGYIQKVAADTGVPASVLAGVIRVESTVPNHTNNSTNWKQIPYTISDYTDEDISQMEQLAQSLPHEYPIARAAITRTLPNDPKKVVCPASASSPTSMGLMQIKMGQTNYGPFIKGVEFLNKFRKDKYPSGITASQVQVKDFCDPLNGMYLGAGFIIGIYEANGGWDPSNINAKDYLRPLVASYFGSATSEAGVMYLDSLSQSISSCQGTVSKPQDLINPSQSACYCSIATNGGLTSSCPVNNGQLITHSYQADNAGGHCSDSYEASVEKCHCGKNGRRAKAIDVSTEGGKEILLPTIRGQTVQWKPISRSYNYDDNYGGKGATFTASQGGDQWYIDFVHLKGSPLDVNGTYPSGTSIGITVKSGTTNHVHFTIGRNLQNPDSVESGSASDCDPGWLPSDFACGGPDVTAQATIDPTSITASSRVLGVTNKKLVVLTPGHAVLGKDNYPGFQGSPASAAPDGVSEGIRTVALSKKIKEKLEEKGYQAELANEGSPGIDIPAGTSASEIVSNYRYKEYQRRIDFSNNLNPALYVEIHFNSVNSSPFYFYDNRQSNPEWTKASKEAGLAITQALYKKLGISGTPQGIDDTGCYAGGCGGHIYTIGPQGLQSDPEQDNPNSVILRENKAVTAYIETLGNMDSRASNLDLLAEAYVEGIISYLSGATYLPDTGGAGTTVTGQICPGITKNNFVFYCQGDPKWENGCAMGQSGCGPTTLAMVMSTFGVMKTPKDVDQIFRDYNLRSCGGPSFFESVLQHKEILPLYGLQVGSSLLREGGILDMGLANQKLTANNLIVASDANDANGKPTFPGISGSRYGHIFVIETVNLADNTVYIRDPANCSYSTGIENAENRVFKQLPDGSLDRIDKNGKLEGRPFFLQYAYPITGGV